MAAFGWLGKKAVKAAEQEATKLAETRAVSPAAQASFADLPDGTKQDLNTWYHRAGESGRPFTIQQTPLSAFPDSWHEDADRAAGYAALKTPIPPVLVRNGSNGPILIDGNHRIGAAKLRGDTHIPTINMDDWQRSASSQASWDRDAAILGGPGRYPAARGDNPTRRGAPMQGAKFGGVDEPLVGGTPEALARAREQGFDTSTPLYHGTDKDFTSFEPSAHGTTGPGVYLTKDPRVANAYAGQNGQVMPLFARGKFDPSGSNTRARREGFDGVKLGDTHVVFDPSNVRSVHAAFDPTKTSSKDLLAGALLGTGIAGAATAAGSQDQADASPLTSALFKRFGEDAVQSAAKGITAYHGSPHAFDKFSMDSIGSGEGAQAFGHGLYFAGNEGVAKSYRDMLTKPSIDGRPIEPTDVRPAVWRALDVNNFDVDKAIDSVRDRVTGLPSGHAFLKMADKDVTDLEQMRGKIQRDGHMYQVNLDVDPNKLLDWDKPVADQSKTIQGVASDLYRLPASKLRNGQTLQPHGAAESQQLLDAGVPGLKYLDGGSRAAGDGSHNYVMFDDKPISILKRYAVPGAIGAGAAAGATALGGQDQADAAPWSNLFKSAGKTALADLPKIGAELPPLATPPRVYESPMKQLIAHPHGPRATAILQRQASARQASDTYFANQRGVLNDAFDRLDETGGDLPWAQRLSDQRAEGSQFDAHDALTDEERVGPLWTSQKPLADSRHQEAIGDRLAQPDFSPRYLNAVGPAALVGGLGAALSGAWNTAKADPLGTALNVGALPAQMAWGLGKSFVQDPAGTAYDMIDPSLGFGREANAADPLPNLHITHAPGSNPEDDDTLKSDLAKVRGMFGRRGR